MVQFLDRPIDFLAELLPLGLHERDAAGSTGRSPPWSGRSWLSRRFLGLLLLRASPPAARELQLLLVEIHHVGHYWRNSPRRLVSATVPSSTSPNSTTLSVLPPPRRSWSGQVQHHQLHQRRTADGFTPTLHSPGQSPLQPAASGVELLPFPADTREPGRRYKSTSQPAVGAEENPPLEPIRDQRT